MTKLTTRRPGALPPVCVFHLPEPYGDVPVDVATFTMGEQARQRAALAKLREHVRAEYDADLSDDDVLVSVVWAVVRRTHDVGIVEFWGELDAGDLRNIDQGEDDSPEA